LQRLERRSDLRHTSREGSSGLVVWVLKDSARRVRGRGGKMRAEGAREAQKERSREGQKERRREGQKGRRREGERERRRERDER
jgi:hypothetical protein